jgi:hypothetical protein
MMPQSADSRSNINPLSGPLSSERSGHTGTRGMAQELSVYTGDFRTPQGRGVPAWTLAVAAVAVLGVAIAGIWVGVRAGRGTTPTVVAAAAASSDRPTNEIELTLEADAPIERVQIAGANRIELASGKARVRLAPWEGPLAIDADLAGGGHAHAEAAASGPRAITLATVAPTAASVRPIVDEGPTANAKPPATATPVATAHAGSGGGAVAVQATKRPVTVPTTKKKGELHDNPYK